jgi:hypothetical protein
MVGLRMTSDGLGPSAVTEDFDTDLCDQTKVSSMSDQGTKSTCRSCGGTKLPVFLNLGSTPLVDRLLSEQQLTEPEPHFPSRLHFAKIAR